MADKKNNLELFSVLHIVKGILTILMSFIFLAYAGMGIFFGEIMEQQDPAAMNEMPFNPGSIFMVFGGAGFLFFLALGIVTLMAAGKLKKRKGRNFIFAISIMNCLTGILGILLGVFTIIEINKKEVKDLFDQESQTLDTF